MLVPTLEDFSLDLSAIESAITPKTAAVLINSPNNPTGKVYSERERHCSGQVARKEEFEIGRDILLISDEPYRGITYDGVVVPSIFKAYANSMVATSFSKDLSLPGERLGYIAVNPGVSDKAATMDGLVLCQPHSWFCQCAGPDSTGGKRRVAGYRGRIGVQASAGQTI